MKRLISCCTAVLLLGVIGTAASAQSRLSGFAGIGATAPMGDLKDADSTKTGFMFLGGFEYAISPNTISLRLDAGMGWNDRDSNFEETAYIWTFNARIEYWLPVQSEKVHPYVLGGAGIFLYKRNAGQTAFANTFETTRRTAFSGGAGVDYMIGSSSVFLEARYEIGEDDRSYIPIMVGMRWRGTQ